MVLFSVGPAIGGCSSLKNTGERNASVDSLLKGQILHGWQTAERKDEQHKGVCLPCQTWIQELLFNIAKCGFTYSGTGF